MTWISLICLLALTSSAVGRAISAYGGYDAGSQAPVLPSVGYQRMIPRTILPINTLVSQSYGQTALPTLLTQRFVMNTPTIDTSSYQQQQQPIQQAYGAQMTLPRTLPVQSYAPASQVAYGAVPMTPQIYQSAPVPVLSQADILCKGRHAEEIIPIDNNRKFVICLDNGKGVEQQCPTGLFFHPESRRCERTSGPLDDACISQPCLNGGQCLTSGSSFQCQCAAGFEGVLCELDARICQTQQPCGTSSDAKCQSFRLGAALPYICIFQNGLSYGLNAQQIIQNPCQGTDGPQALAVSRNGFIMCDSERLFVESCPGGTIWDDIEKACSWPDQQAAPQESKTLSSAYGYGSQMIPQQQPVQSYGSQTVIPQQPVQSYGSQTTIPQQPIQSYGSQTTIPQQQPVQSYGSRTIIPQQPVQSYGAQTTIPQQPIQSYGSQTTIPQQQPVQSYGSQATIPKQLPVQSYGSQPTIPQQPVQSYGSQTVIPQQTQTIIPKQLLQPVQSYGAQITVPQQQPTMIVAKQLLQPVQSYGSQSTIPQQQPAQSYGAQTTIPQQQPIQSYGSQTTIPQQQPVQSYGSQPTIPQQQPVVIAAKQLVQPTQSYGSGVQASQGLPTISAQQDVLTLQPGKPYGAAEFTTSHKS